MAEPAELVRAWFRAYNERDVEGMRAVMAPDFRAERPGSVTDGPEAMIASYKAECARYPDGRIDVTEVANSGSSVVTEIEWVTANTVAVVLRDGTTVPPTGKKLILPYVVTSEARDGLLVLMRFSYLRDGRVAE